MGKTFTILIVGGHMHRSITDLLLLTSRSPLHIGKPKEVREIGITPHFDVQDLLEEIDQHESEHIRRTHKVLIPTLKLRSDDFIDTSLTFSEHYALKQKEDVRTSMANLVLQIITDAKQRIEINEIPVLHLVNRPPLPDHYPCWETIGNVDVSDFSIERTHIIRPPPISHLSQVAFLFTIPNFRKNY